MLLLVSRGGEFYMLGAILQVFGRLPPCIISHSWTREVGQTYFEGLGFRAFVRLTCAAGLLRFTLNH